VAWCNARSG